MGAKEASVISTGGGGHDFERRVGAYFLALLLTKSFTPIFPDCVPTRVHFQARRLKNRIDDFVVETEGEDGQKRKIAAQVKRTFTLSINDDECKQTFAAAWKDFNNAELFRQGHDAIALITYLGTNRLQHEVRWLIGQAKAASSAADFRSRREGEATLNKQQKADYATIKALLDLANGESVADEKVWQFLQAFHVLDFDFQDSAAKDVATTLSMLAAQRRANVPSGDVSSTWSELVDCAGLAASEGRSVDYAALPERTRERHTQIPNAKHAEVARLRNHSATTLRRISTTGPAAMVFPRHEIQAELDEATANYQVVLIVGPAGSGKSALAKGVLRGVASSDTNFVFAAEEFKVAHIDTVLSQIGVHLSWPELTELLPLHRKTFLIDGMERLLEASDRGAFTDLLGSAKDNSSLSLVITCRDYYAEVVEQNLLIPSGVAYAKVVVGGLSDAELSEAEKAEPHLAPLLANPALRAILRNPFLLTRAAQLRFGADSSVPQTERAFRQRLWADLIRKDAYPANGMPRKREKLFFDVCVSRARALRPYVVVEDLDGALDLLSNDNLLVRDATGNAVAAAHDVFEDWGLIEWLTLRFTAIGDDVAGLIADVGEHPALRRAYRKWLAEVLDANHAGVRASVAALLGSAGAPEHFKDDTWLAVFHSSAAGDFLNNSAGELLASDGALLGRALRLIRVGCKTVAPSAKGESPVARSYLPTGPAWVVLLDFMARHWANVPKSLEPTIMAFMEDWAALVSTQDPLPPGSAAVGSLVESILSRSRSEPGTYVTRERPLNLLLKVPKANERHFKALAARAAAAGSLQRDEDARHVAKMALNPLPMAFARDFPSELKAVVLARLFSDEESSRRRFGDIEGIFGLISDYEQNFFPATAWQGPFMPLLRSDASAVPFLVEFVNECCANYQRSSANVGLVEGPYEAKLTLSDGVERVVLSNDRLWRAFRGSSATPGALQCALMALERRLLEIGEHSQPDVFQSFLSFILRSSNNSALLAVVASACMAFPLKAGNCAVDILGCRDFIELDTVRMATERHASNGESYGPHAEAFRQERTESNARAHRKHSLEGLAIHLQRMADTAPLAHAVLDHFLADMPAEDARSEAESLWMLALLRMDLRTYESKDFGGVVEISMGQLPSDIQALRKRAEPGQQIFARQMALQNWAQRMLAKEQVSDVDWKQMLELAKTAEAELAASGLRELMDGGGRMVAAVLARDYWKSLEAADRTWCLATVMDCLGAISDDGHGGFSGSIPVDGPRECATVVGELAALLSQNDAELLMGVALTHPNDHVQARAASSLQCDSFLARPDLVNFALHVLTWESQAIAAERQKIEAEEARNRDSWKSRPSVLVRFSDRRASFAALNKAGWSVAPPTWAPQLIEQDGRLGLSLIGMVGERHGHPFASQLFLWIASQLPNWWNSRRGRSSVDIELRLTATRKLAAFMVSSEETAAIALLQQLLAAVDKEPMEFATFLNEMIESAAARPGDSGAFWPLWRLIVSRARAAEWFKSVESDRSWGQELVRKLFLNAQWTPEIREWSRLGDAHAEVDALFLAAPPSSVVLESYVFYLLAIGNRSLPKALAHIHGRFGVGLGTALSSSTNARSLVDRLASRLMFEHLPALQQPDLRGAMLGVLDALIQAQSSNAFLLREDFLTPSGGAAR